MNTKAIRKNLIYGIIYQLIFTIAGLLIRKLFTVYLNTYYLGVAAVFDNVCGLLNLLSFGFGSSCLFYLYKAFAAGDEDAFISTFKLFKKYYRRVAIGVFVVGLIILININWIINVDENNINYIRSLFFIVIIKASLTYILTCERETLQCDEKRYYSLQADLIMLILFTLFKAAAIIFTKSYALFSVLCLLEMVFSNLYIKLCFDKNYSHINFSKEIDLVSKSTQIKTYAKSLMLSNISYFVYSGTDNLVLSKICGTITVGLMSNYYSIVNGVNSISSIISNAIYSSTIKKINISDSTEKAYSYSVFMFFSFVVGSFMTIFLYGLTDSFVSIYYGSSFVMDNSIILFMSINVLLSSFQTTSVRFIVADGLVNKELKFSIASTITNIISSVILAYTIGPSGVLIGTVIANLILLFGQDYIVNKYSVKLKSSTLLKKYILIIFTILILYVLSLINLPNTFSYWFIKAAICLLIWVVSIMCFSRWNEFKLFIDVLKNTIKNMMA